MQASVNDDLSKQTPFFKQFGEHQLVISQILNKKQILLSEQDVVMTGNHTVTQHH